MTAALVLALAAPARSQTVAVPAPGTSGAPSPAPSPAFACVPRQANLGGVGRASVVAFTGAIFGDRVCATVANLALDGVTAQFADGVPAEALVVASLGGGPGGRLTISAGVPVVTPAEGTPVRGDDASAPVGPFVIAPGGHVAGFADDSTPERRVVLAYAGSRLLVIGFSPVALGDLARVLRDQPDLFGADAIERAVVLAGGADAGLTVNAADGQLGAAARTGRNVVLIKRS